MCVLGPFKSFVSVHINDPVYACFGMAFYVRIEEDDHLWSEFYGHQLGEPSNDATYAYDDGVWLRKFITGTTVQFDTTTKKGYIWWGGEEPRRRLLSGRKKMSRRKTRKKKVQDDKNKRKRAQRIKALARKKKKANRKKTEQTKKADSAKKANEPPVANPRRELQETAYD